MSGERFEPPADLEVAGSWRAASARWRRVAGSRTEAAGDVETEELREGEGLPESPRPGRTYRNIARRWRLSVWLRDPGRGTRAGTDPVIEERHGHQDKEADD